MGGTRTAQQGQNQGQQQNSYSNMTRRVVRQNSSDPVRTKAVVGVGDNIGVEYEEVLSLEKFEDQIADRLENEA